MLGQWWATDGSKSEEERERGGVGERLRRWFNNNREDIGLDNRNCICTMWTCSGDALVGHIRDSTAQSGSHLHHKQQHLKL